MAFRLLCAIKFLELLLFHQRRIHSPMARHQLLVCTLLNNLPIRYHRDRVRVLDSRQSVRNNDCRSTTCRLVQSLLYNLLRFAVESTRRLIKQQDLRVPYYRSGNCNTLPLSSAQLPTVCPNLRVVALGQLHHKLVCVCKPRRVDDILLRHYGSLRLSHAKSNVLANRRREKLGLLGHKSDVVSHRRKIPVFQRLPIHLHCPRIGVIKPLRKSHNRTLS
mmetsp:Transcript_6877/g.10102  ORF Transcript_6877/g.10102 Transcript_6877/m.10102 type:complete len:219 (+) Transcript_6877:154-810(+)